MTVYVRQPVSVNKSRTLIVEPAYECASEMGRRIKEILETPPPPRTQPRRGRPPKRAKKTDTDMAAGGMQPKDIATSASSKVKNQTAKNTTPEATKKSPPPKRHTITMATPVSPRKQRAPFDPKRMANFGGMKPIGTKTPGAKHPAWPSQGSAHHRTLRPAFRPRDFAFSPKIALPRACHHCRPAFRRL